MIPTELIERIHRWREVKERFAESSTCAFQDLPIGAKFQLVFGEDVREFTKVANDGYYTARKEFDRRGKIHVRDTAVVRRV